MSKVVTLKQLIRENPFDTVIIPERMKWTSSALRQFRKCRRKFFWKYMMRVKPRIKAGSLIIGSAFHEALGEWYKGRGSVMEKIAARHAKAAEATAKVGADLYDSDEYDKLTTTIETLVGMLSGYAGIYADDRAGWELKREHVEVEFVVDCGDFDFGGKIDVLTRKKGGKNWFVVEHKTASKIGGSYMERLPLDTQVRAYIFGADRGVGVKPTEVLYDVVRKCSLRRKSNEAHDDYNQRIALDYQARPDFYFYREPLKFAKDDIAAFEYELHQTHKEYQAIVRGDFGDPRDPRSWTPNDATCNEYFRTCEYFGLCTIGLDRGTAMGFEQDAAMHEELSEEP